MRQEIPPPHTHKHTSPTSPPPESVFSGGGGGGGGDGGGGGGGGGDDDDEDEDDDGVRNAFQGICKVLWGFFDPIFSFGPTLRV